MDLVDRIHSSFTNRELERLEAYRAAVAAGFYTDWDGSAEAADTDLLAWLRDDIMANVGAGYPFTAEERARLEHCRAALVGGDYADDQPPITTAATPQEPAR